MRKSSQWNAHNHKRYDETKQMFQWRSEVGMQENYKQDHDGPDHRYWKSGATFWNRLRTLSKTFRYFMELYFFANRVREKSRECHNHKTQPFPDPKRKRKLTNPNKHKSNKRTESTKISSLFPMRGNRNTKRTEKHKNKMTHGKTYNKSPRRINHKATKSKTNTGTTALERSVE